MPQNRNCVLDSSAIERKLKRMALQIAEQNILEDAIIIAGVNGNGAIVAQCLLQHLKQIAAFDTRLLTIQLNKKDPVDVALQPAVNVNNKTIIVVDDVANTGKTLLFALKPFLNERPKKIQTLVLVERSHKMFPVQTDYAGLSIATTLQEHIRVETEGEKLVGAWLY